MDFLVQAMTRMPIQIPPPTPRCPPVVHFANPTLVGCFIFIQLPIKFPHPKIPGTSGNAARHSMAESFHSAMVCLFNGKWIIPPSENFPYRMEKKDEGFAPLWMCRCELLRMRKYGKVDFKYGLCNLIL